MAPINLCTAGEPSQVVEMQSAVTGSMVLNPGALVCVPAWMAQVWFERGLAIPVSSAAPEAAVVSAPERMIRPRARGRG